MFVRIFGSTLIPIQIYADKITPRLEYACSILFGIVLQAPYKLQFTRAEMMAGNGQPIIYYTTNLGQKGFCVRPSGLVFEEGLHPLEPDVTWKNGVPMLFPNLQNCSLGFDIFSATFFMASRYEEYLPFTPDSFGRFPEVESLSGKFDFTHLPVVHLWALLLGQKLGSLFKSFSLPEKKPSALFTYDIDVAFAYKGRSLKTHLLSLARDVLTGKFSTIRQKISHGFGTLKDPSDTYKVLENNSLQKIVFFLVKNKRTRYDRNISPGSPAFINLVQRLLQKGFVLGVHPSYLSSDKTEFIKEEKNTLQSIVNQKITHSRQHFLRFQMPTTFRALLKEGIEHEYSMQYPEMPGFRAGMCLPFPFFDVLANQVTKLYMHPGCIMETTFRDDLHIPANQSLEWYKSLWEQVKKVGGQFICIWHNDTLWDNLPDDNKLAFRQVHEKMVEIIKKDLQAQSPH